MQEIKVSRQVAARLGDFLASHWFAKVNAQAKSEYWDYHARQMAASVNIASVGVAGKSGFYVPEVASAPARVLGKVRRAFSSPAELVERIRDKIREWFGVPRLFAYREAFDATMSAARISEPILSPYRIDHRRLRQTQGILVSSADVAAHYARWSTYTASDSIYYHYYYQNLLRHFTHGKAVSTVLEIGAGNGNFPSIFFHDWKPVRVILVDLPETLAVAIPFLANLFPEAKLVFPQEVLAVGLGEDFDFAFLTVDQLDLVGDSTVDLAINCHSFQEMTHGQIATYFDFVQRTVCDGGFFFAANRIEKIPCGPDAYSVEQRDPPNRFAEYPWKAGNEVLIYEVSRLSRLTQLDDIGLRLERIRKLHAQSMEAA